MTYRNIFTNIKTVYRLTQHGSEVHTKDRQSWGELAMEAALVAVNNGEGLRSASRKYDVPLTTLQRRKNSVNRNASGASKALGNYKVIKIKSDLAVYTQVRVCGLTDSIYTRNFIYSRT